MSWPRACVSRLWARVADEVDGAGQVLAHGGAGALLLGHSTLAMCIDQETRVLGDEGDEHVDAGVAV